MSRKEEDGRVARMKDLLSKGGGPGKGGPGFILPKPNPKPKPRPKPTPLAEAQGTDQLDGDGTSAPVSPRSPDQAEDPGIIVLNTDSLRQFCEPLDYDFDAVVRQQLLDTSAQKDRAALSQSKGLQNRRLPKSIAGKVPEDYSERRRANTYSGKVQRSVKQPMEDSVDGPEMSEEERKQKNLAKLGVQQSNNPLAALGNLLKRNSSDRGSLTRKRPKSPKKSLQGSPGVPPKTKKKSLDVPPSPIRLGSEPPQSLPKSPKGFLRGLRRNSSKSKKKMDGDDMASETSSIVSLPVQYTLDETPASMDTTPSVSPLKSAERSAPLKSAERSAPKPTNTVSSTPAVKENGSFAPMHTSSPHLVPLRDKTSSTSPSTHRKTTDSSIFKEGTYEPLFGSTSNLFDSRELDALMGKEKTPERGLPKQQNAGKDTPDGDRAVSPIAKVPEKKTNGPVSRHPALPKPEKKRSVDSPRMGMRASLQRYESNSSVSKTDFSSVASEFDSTMASVSESVTEEKTPSSASEPKRKGALLFEECEDDLFGPAKTSGGDKTAEDKAIDAKKASLFDDDDELFAAKKPVKSSLKKETAPSFLQDSKVVEKPAPKKTKSHDLFGDSLDDEVEKKDVKKGESVDIKGKSREDIFGEVKSRRKKEAVLEGVKTTKKDNVEVKRRSGEDMLRDVESRRKSQEAVLEDAKTTKKEDNIEVKGKRGSREDRLRDVEPKRKSQESMLEDAKATKMEDKEDALGGVEARRKSQEAVLESVDVKEEVDGDPELIDVAREAKTKKKDEVDIFGSPEVKKKDDIFGDALFDDIGAETSTKSPKHASLFDEDKSSPSLFSRERRALKTNTDNGSRISDSDGLFTDTSPKTSPKTERAKTVKVTDVDSFDPLGAIDSQFQQINNELNDELEFLEEAERKSRESTAPPAEDDGKDQLPNLVANCEDVAKDSLTAETDSKAASASSTKTRNGTSAADRKDASGSSRVSRGSGKDETGKPSWMEELRKRKAGDGGSVAPATAPKKKESVEPPMPEWKKAALERKKKAEQGEGSSAPKKKEVVEPQVPEWKKRALERKKKAEDAKLTDPKVGRTSPMKSPASARKAAVKTPVNGRSSPLSGRKSPIVSPETRVKKEEVSRSPLASRYKTREKEEKEKDVKKDDADVSETRPRYKTRREREEKEEKEKEKEVEGNEEISTSKKEDDTDSSEVKTIQEREEKEKEGEAQKTETVSPEPKSRHKTLLERKKEREEMQKKADAEVSEVRMRFKAKREREKEEKEREEKEKEAAKPRYKTRREREQEEREKEEKEKEKKKETATESETKTRYNTRRERAKENKAAKPSDSPSPTKSKPVLSKKPSIEVISRKKLSSSKSSETAEDGKSSRVSQVDDGQSSKKADTDDEVFSAGDSSEQRSTSNLSLRRTPSPKISLDALSSVLASTEAAVDEVTTENGHKDETKLNEGKKLAITTTSTVSPTHTQNGGSSKSSVSSDRDLLAEPKPTRSHTISLSSRSPTPPTSMASSDSIPEWKRQLMERKKSTSSPVQKSAPKKIEAASAESNIPQWKRDLLTKKKTAKPEETGARNRSATVNAASSVRAKAKEPTPTPHFMKEVQKKKLHNS